MQAVGIDTMTDIIRSGPDLLQRLSLRGHWDVLEALLRRRSNLWTGLQTVDAFRALVVAAAVGRLSAVEAILCLTPVGMAINPAWPGPFSSWSAMQMVFLHVSMQASAVSVAEHASSGSLATQHAAVCQLLYGTIVALHASIVVAHGYLLHTVVGRRDVGWSSLAACAA